MSNNQCFNLSFSVNTEYESRSGARLDMTRIGRGRESADSQAGVVFPGTGETRLIHSLLAHFASHVQCRARPCRETRRQCMQGSDRSGHTCGNVLEGYQIVIAQQRKASALRSGGISGAIVELLGAESRSLDLLAHGSRG